MRHGGTKRTKDFQSYRVQFNLSTEQIISFERLMLQSICEFLALDPGYSASSTVLLAFSPHFLRAASMSSADGEPSVTTVTCLQCEMMLTRVIVLVQAP